MFVCKHKGENKMGKLKDVLLNNKTFVLSFRLNMKDIVNLDEGKSVLIDIKGVKYNIKEIEKEK